MISLPLIVVMEPETVAKIREYGLIVTETTTNPSRRGKQPKPVWNITGVNLSRYEDLLRDQMGLKKWKGSFSAWSDPCDELLELLEEALPMSIQEQHEFAADRSTDRAARLSDRAHKHHQAGNALLKQADDISQRFAFGQPILVGHHSEQRARADRDRMWSKASKGIGENQYGDHLSVRAAASESHAERKTTYTLEYAGNRLKEAEAEFRDAERKLGIQVNDYILYVGENSEFKDKKCEVTLKSKDGATLIICLLRPEGTKMAEWDYPTLECPASDVEQTMTEGSRLDWENIKQSAQEAIAFWTEQIQELGGEQFSPETIKVGDYVNRGYGWREVKRVNRKSVSVATGYSWTDTCEYTKIKAHLSAADYQQRLQQSQSESQSGDSDAKD